jgi:type I restriction enzyme, S subunit
VITDVGRWKTASLSELVLDPRHDIVDGPFGSRLKASEYVNSGVPIVRLQNIDRNRFIDKNIKFVTEEKAAEIARHHFIAGDILISKLGDPLGEACIAPSSIPYGILVADVVRVRPNKAKVDCAFLSYVINSAAVVTQFKAETKGTTRPRVNLRKIRDLRIPFVDSLDKQREIVAEIEKQFTRLEAGVAGLRRVQAKLKRYRAAVLKAACEGKLVPTEAELARQEGRTYETGAQLLDRILTERRHKWSGKGKYKEPATPKKENFSELPEGWTWATLDQAFIVERGRFSIRPRNDPRYYVGPHPFVQIGDLPRDGGSISSYSQTLNDAGLKVSKKFRTGTVLIAIVGATIANTGILTFDSCCPDSLVAIHSRSKVTLRLCEMYLRSVKMQLRNASYASGGQPNINLTTLVPLTIPLPPLAEQERIVAEVERRLSVVEELETVVNGNVQRAARLRQAILQRNFSGDLSTTRKLVNERY